MEETSNHQADNMSYHMDASPEKKATSTLFQRDQEQCGHNMSSKIVKELANRDLLSPRLTSLPWLLWDQFASNSDQPESGYGPIP